MRTEDVERLLSDLGTSKMVTKHKSNSTWVNGCCPIHAEKTPSFGVCVDSLIYNCYVCGAGGLPNLVMQVRGCSYFRALTFLMDYGYNPQEVERKVERVAAKVEQIILPPEELDKYKSGRVYHPYMRERGFTKETCKKFLVGWDAERCRITFPLFDRDDNLCGFIRRAVLNPTVENGEENAEYLSLYGTEQRYYLDNTIQKAHSLFPLQHFQMPEDRTAIVVEGFLDCAWMHQMGFYNTLSIINAKINEPQIEMLKKLGIRKIIMMLDNDKAGEDGKEKMLKLMQKNFFLYDVKWPEGVKDPAELTKEQAQEMISGAKVVFAKKLKRRT